MRVRPHEEIERKLRDEDLQVGRLAQINVRVQVYPCRGRAA